MTIGIDKGNEGKRLGEKGVLSGYCSALQHLGHTLQVQAMDDLVWSIISEGQESEVSEDLEG